MVLIKLINSYFKLKEDGEKTQWLRPLAVLTKEPSSSQHSPGGSKSSVTPRESNILIYLPMALDIYVVHIHTYSTLIHMK